VGAASNIKHTDVERKGEEDKEDKEIRVYENWEMIKGIKIYSDFSTPEISLPLYTS